MLVETKRHHPDYTNWVFFPRGARSDDSREEIRFSVVDCLVSGDRWSSRSGTRLVRTSVPLADDARETRADYQKQQTTTHLEAISEAAYQVALATEALVAEEKRFADVRATALRQPQMPYKYQMFLPTIVTTAKLLLCAFNANEVGTASGEIDAKNVTFEARPYLYFEYPLPKHLHRGEHLTSEQAEKSSRLPILVVESSAWTTVLKEFAEGTATVLAPAGPIEPDPMPNLSIDELRMRRALFSELEFNEAVLWDAKNQQRFGMIERSAWRAASGLKLSTRVQGNLQDAYRWAGAYEVAVGRIPPPGNETVREMVIKEARTLAETSAGWFEKSKQQLMEDEPEGVLS